MFPGNLTELFMLVALLGLFILPSGALLTVSGTWRNCPSLQRFIVAIGLSIAFYQILFYTLCFWFPAVMLGSLKIGVLIICAAIIGWGLRRHWRELFQFDVLEWIAIAIFVLTMLTRLWVAHSHPFPAWSDSLHHTLLTQLTVQQGRLPVNLEPFSPFHSKCIIWVSIHLPLLLNGLPKPPPIRPCVKNEVHADVVTG